ncbi:MlaE family ABC transporter permease [Nocardioides caeni]|uniref:ABC transporter permease n=1 Tax=Nocardioides caeni TaxID=574700 RepID=A0A4S8MZG8_9ACTN|nr:ABC transporter permease [Nocardioides caeni]THV08833.1 ABC transporter permease [Nocardioides caeni]
MAVTDRWSDRLAALGHQLLFYGRSIAATPSAFRHHRREVWRLLGEASFGTGALAVIGGTFGIILLLSFFTGTEVGLQGFTGLDNIGASVFTGFISAYFNTREIAPIVAGISLSATLGAGFTGQLGAMRIAEEIDALESMAIPPIPYLVTTRVVAGMIAVVPLYLAGLFSSYFATRLIVTGTFGQSTGSYDHYFHLFLPPLDVLLSLVKALIFAVIVILVHCYYGFTASGGPGGVGVAVGRAVRAAIVLVTVSDFFISLAFWGATDTVRIAG